MQPNCAELAPELRPVQRRLDARCPQRLNIRNEVATLLDDGRLDFLHAVDDARGCFEADVQARLFACAVKRRRREGTMMDVSPRGRS